MPISPAKMTFLTANYGLTPEQINAFAEAYQAAYRSFSDDIEYSWGVMGWTPEDPEAAMIECLCDADRLSGFIDDYDDWCFDFLMKGELAHDILEVPMPKHSQKYLEKQGKSWWTKAA
jgi:hypothetical protein